MESDAPQLPALTAKRPSKWLSTDLMDHQVETLAFMKRVEETAIPAKLSKGGFILHEQGVGKSLIALAHLLRKHEEHGNVPVNSTSRPKIDILLVKASLAPMWEDQIKTHTTLKKGRNYCIYSKSADLGKLTRFLSIQEHGEPLIMVLTYTTLYNLTSKQTEDWRRLFLERVHNLILDEAHNIRRMNSLCFKETYLLAYVASCIWLMTATPMVNDMADYNAYCCLLQLDGKAHMYEHKHWDWKDLERLLAQLSIKRTKKDIGHRQGMKVEYRHVILSDMERQFYDNYNQHATDQLQKLMQSMTKPADHRRQQRKTTKKFTPGMSADQMRHQHMQRLNLRLRQVASCIWLANTGGEDVYAAKEKFKEQVRANMQKFMKDLNRIKDVNTDEECMICYEEQSNCCLMPCCHVIGYECYLRLHAHHNPYEEAPKCPYCREKIVAAADVKETARDLQERVDNHDAIEQEGQDQIERFMTELPSKVKVAVDTAKRNEAKGKRTVIVSQWRGMIRILEGALTERNIMHATAVGGTTISKRYKRISEFQRDNNVNTLILSIQACSEGLTIDADTLLIMEPFFNLATESQMTHRLHRIGLTRSVNVIHLISQGTVEEAVTQAQIHKLDDEVRLEESLAQRTDGDYHTTWGELEALYGNERLKRVKTTPAKSRGVSFDDTLTESFGESDRENDVIVLVDDE